MSPSSSVQGPCFQPPHCTTSSGLHSTVREDVATSRTSLEKPPTRTDYRHTSLFLCCLPTRPAPRHLFSSSLSEIPPQTYLWTAMNLVPISLFHQGFPQTLTETSYPGSPGWNAKSQEDTLTHWASGETAGGSVRNEQRNRAMFETYTSMGVRGPL